MPTISTLTIDVQTRTSSFSRGLRTMTVGLAALAGGAIYAFKQFEDAENVTQQTAAVLKSTGGAAKTTAGQVEELADALSVKAGVDDEVIQAGENMLLTFKNIRNEAGKGNDIFNQATTATLDLAAGMAAASGGQVDMKASAIQLGKALNDPVLGLTSLTRVGVQFSEEQRKQIEQFVKHNNLLAAQKIILAEVTSQFEGSAAAQRTASGSLRVAFENLAESIGAVLAPVITKLVSWLTTLADWFTSLPKGMQEFIVAGAAIAVVVALATKAFGLFAPAIQLVVGAIRVLTVALATNPYILIAAATIAIAILIVKNWNTIKAFLLKVWDSIVDAAKFFWDHLAVFIIGPMKLVIDWLIDHWRGFRTAFLAIWDAIRDAIGPIVGAIVDTIKGIVDVLMDVIHAVQAAISWLGKLGGASSAGLGGGHIPPGGVSGGKVPSFQHGGVMASTGLAFLHAGETIIPAGGGGLTIIINGDVTGEEVVRKVRDGLLRLQARNATTGL